jgi:hypothetical protein
LVRRREIAVRRGALRRPALALVLRFRLLVVLDALLLEILAVFLRTLPCLLNN